ncbi:hypothetical protein LOK49_LG07G00802 [Camellia lanceoleosa]|uniref:Uncharacterized protein n=1 Tax=Camellia lanceoleosa TaxID=1840588 RepID=A0ACC0H6L2_9ERIC|nr:hypothetical protein LOK49_LG07G00802 [Camellia lanceoleosa]
MEKALECKSSSSIGGGGGGKAVIRMICRSLVLHPQSIRPVRESDIPVRVKNSYNPKAPGKMTSIVLKRNVTTLDIVSTRMLGQYGFLAKVFSTFEDLGIYVDVVATSEASISLTLDPSKLEQELIQASAFISFFV